MVNTPNIRFAGFSDEWVQRKLGELLTRTHRPTVNRSLVTVGESQTKLRTQENQGYNSKLTDIDTTKYAGINFGDVLVDLSSYSRGFYISTMDGLTSKAYHVLSHDFKEYRLIFLKYILVNRQILKQLPGLTPIGVRQGKSLPVGDVLTLNVSLPSEAKEQEKIGSIFATLDHKIGLEERQIALLKDLKKGYLQKMFPKNGAKVPELRFAGFADDWEERKLGELASFSKGNGYTKNDLVEFGDPIILYGRLYTKYETVIEKVDTFVNKKDKSIISEGSEVIVPASGESSEDISRASVVGKSGIILGGDLNIIKPVNYIDSIFLALTISNGSQQKEMSKRAQGKSVVHLHNSDLKQVNILYPKLEEQQKIGVFFKHLDDTIARHQRKLDLLKDLKKGLSQQMFV